MSFSEIMGLVTGLLQFIVAGYALRLNRIFGTARVGWSLFCAFSLLALLHFIQSVTSFNNGVPLGTEMEVIYSLISLLLLIGMVHIETLLRERLQAEQDGKRLRDELEMLVKDKTAHLNKIIQDSQRETAKHTEVEKALARERLLLRALIDNLPDLIFVKDPQSRFTVVNMACARQLGTSCPEEVLGKSDADFVTPELAGQYRADELALMQSGWPVHQEERTQHKALGEMRWSLTTKIPLKDDAGNGVGLMGIARDITERKRTEQALNEHMQQLGEVLDFNKKIIHEASAGILVFKATGECVLANEFAAQAINGTVPQLFKQNFRQLDSWRTCDMLKAAEKTLVTGKPQQCESHFTSSFGKEVWLHCHFTNFIRGNEPHLLLIFNDITSAKQAEMQIREQAALLDKAQDAILVLDVDGRILYWNQSAERIYGWTAAEAIGKTPVDLLYKGLVTPQLANAMKTVDQRGEWAGELQEFAKDGRAITVQGRCNLIHDEQGRPKTRLIINTDITERKSLEAQFLRSQRVEGIGSLASGIAHDMNNVLTPLLVAVQILKEKVRDEDGQKLLQALEANVQRGAGLVKQVLAFGRGMSGDRITVNPKHIAREIKQIIQETFPKSLQFEMRTAPDLWTITGDPTQLHQILLNLCVNARDAMPLGGKLFLGLDNVVFDETYAGMNPEAQAGPYICLQVTDTGTGIPKDIQARIFDPFFTTKEPGKGTGLGLSTTQAIVKSHGGFIHLQSAPGEGTTFKIYLPAQATPAANEAGSTEQSQLPRGHNELVLVVDDEEPIRRIARKTLERFGYRVELAENGSEAISKYKAHKKDIAVVVTDMVMPVMDGPSTITALKAINAKVKIISSTGMASEGGLAKARASGVRHFIPKPYTAETMLTTLDEILHEHNGN